MTTTIDDTDLCMCEHLLDEHSDKGHGPCTIKGCACVAFVFENVEHWGPETAERLTRATGIRLMFCKAHGIVKPPCMQCEAGVKADKQLRGNR